MANASSCELQLRTSRLAGGRARRPMLCDDALAARTIRVSGPTALLWPSGPVGAQSSCGFDLPGAGLLDRVSQAMPVETLVLIGPDYRALTDGEAA
jgi:hypothetical protein